jgi:ABC-type sugar transport system permease subunit
MDMNETIEKQPERKKWTLTRQRKDMIYYCLMMAYPIAQFCVFYIGVNINGILLSFQKYDVLTNKLIFDPAGSLGAAFKTLTNVPFYMWRNSMLVYLSGLLISTPMTLLLSYYIYKKLFAANTFRTLLFLPGIISGTVLVAIFTFFAERAIPEIVLRVSGKKIIGLIESESTRLATILIFGLWTGFGGGILMYSNAMNAISPDVVEAAHVEGATGIKEFWYITLPLIYPTLSVLLITGVGGLFLSDLGLYTYFRTAAPPELHSYSYILMLQTLSAASNADYAVLSAIGFLITCVLVPMTLLIRRLMERFGPSTEEVVRHAKFGKHTNAEKK